MGSNKTVDGWYHGKYEVMNKHEIRARALTSVC